MTAAHYGFTITKGGVKNAFLQVRIDVDVPDQELAVEPVPELREALQQRPDELVLSRACYGLIDAPRRWWKALVHDLQGLNWRCCRDEP